MADFQRDRMLGKLMDTRKWDVLIIGGGATGLGVAVDAATRGYKTLLVEQEDFAKGTSSRSTKLVHGGVRYLAQGNIGLVREALKERGLLLKNAPHLTKNEAFIIPCYSWFMGLFYALGLKMYDWLSGSLSLGKSKLIGKKEVVKRFPIIREESLKCGVLYHDGTFDDARLAINLAQTAAENGAVVLNYCKVISLQKGIQNIIRGATVVDRETSREYKIEADVVINATGVFADEIIQLDNLEARSIIRPSQGIHLVLDGHFLKSKDALMIPHTDDGRVLFAIPWYDKVLVGTTDTPLNNHSLEPRALESEIDFVLKNSGKYFAESPGRNDVRSVFAGLRPLAATGDASEKTKEISRSHKVIISPAGLVSVIGGKWTTYRKMAEDTLDKVINKQMLPHRKCVTAGLRIHGYDDSSDHTDRLSLYGSDKTDIRELAKQHSDFSKTLGTKTLLIDAQVVWAVRNEMARTVEDVLARRTRILFYDAAAAMEAAPWVADRMMDELGKDNAWKADQLNRFKKLADQYLLSEDA